MEEKHKNSMNKSDEGARIAKFAKALGHPTRVSIMHFLAEHENCYFFDIHDALPIAKATVSQHLKELKNAGLILGEIEPPKVKYTINSEAWDEMRVLFADLFDMCGCKKSNCHCN